MPPARETGASHKWRHLFIGLLLVGITMKWANFGSGFIIVLLVVGYLLLRYATIPLARFIARTRSSIQWKFEIAIAIVGAMFLAGSLFSFGAMESMHSGLHDIEDIGPLASFTEVLQAVDDLENENHGILFSLTIHLGVMAVALSALLGAAMAWTVIAPVRRMEETMRRIGSGDFSHLAEVENDDELGDLALQVNNTARELARLQEITQAELRGAQIIQNTLLPTEAPALPGWEVTARYVPARAVGGDFYDYLDLPDGRFGLVVGDVADKGVPAALVMATTRTLIRSVAQRGESPGQVLEQVNDLLCPDIPPNMFSTCLYAVLDPKTGRLEYANAGHGLPYLRGREGVQELRATGMPLGLMPGMQYEMKETTVAAGDTVLFHSDGLVEAHNRRNELFGFPRLKGLVADHPGGADLIDHLMAELVEFSGTSSEQEDDVTLVTLQREPVERDKVAPQPSTSPAAQVADVDSWRTLADFELPSEPGNERQAMERVADEVRDLGLSPGRLERLKTAVAEATMNAMEHGNEYRSDLPVTIEMLASDRALSVRITDHSGGRDIPEPREPDLEAKLAGLETTRGWGLFLIEKMVDDMHVTSDETHHTVELVMYLEGDEDDHQTS